MTDKQIIEALKAENRRLEKRCNVYAQLLRASIGKAIKQAIDEAVK